jgi:hypothetical protein
MFIGVPLEKRLPSYVAMVRGGIQQVKDLLKEKWDSNRTMFNISDMQKHVGKIAWLGKGAPWIYKLMSHIYTLLAFALKSNKQLLAKSSNEFKALVKQIECKSFSGKQADLQQHIKFTMKRAAKMVNKHPQLYLINHTM